MGIGRAPAPNDLGECGLALAIDLARSEIDAQVLLDAAGRAEAIFPDTGEPPVTSSNWTTTTYTS